ncbi:FadR/GntR family transcriptional regulator [Metabacillus arenae]|uniref:FadR/GntR family transcriptional regulator n=1 Tax=Metabacillus arenae TaxID=2771434 RepID=UPI001CD09577
MGEINGLEVKIKSVNRKTLSKQVIDEIIDLLMTGQLKPGERLPSEFQLMDICNVSRPVIREALTSLEVMGIINRKTRNGTFFSDKVGNEPFSMMLALSAGDLLSITEIRVALELGLVTLAAEKITDEDLAKLRGTIDRMKVLTTEDSSEEDKEFHKIIAQSAKNALFEGIINPLQQFHHKILEKIPLEERDLKETMRQHIEIYNALEKRDPIAAYSSMYHHLNYVRQKAIKSLKPR